MWQLFVLLFSGFLIILLSRLCEILYLNYLWVFVFHFQFRKPTQECNNANDTIWFLVQHYSWDPNTLLILPSADWCWICILTSSTAVSIIAWNVCLFYRCELDVSYKYFFFFFTLTGNYNGDPNDDNIKPNGDIASNSNELGQSWLVTDNNTMYVQESNHIC